MIKHLSGEYETVEYENKRSFLLHDNYDNEAYPIHWHNAVEILMPLENFYIVNSLDKEYVIPVYDVLIIPPAELHSMPAVKGHRLILQCDNSVFADISAFEPVMHGLASPMLIDSNLDKRLHCLAKKTMLNIYELNDRKSELAGYSKYHFSRIFKQYNSMSYLQYINARRIKNAEILLLDPDIPVTEAAMRSGFKSLTTFNRIFKEIKHCTPTDFKKFYSES